MLSLQLPYYSSEGYVIKPHHSNSDTYSSGAPADFRWAENANTEYSHFLLFADRGQTLTHNHCAVLRIPGDICSALMNQAFLSRGPQNLLLSDCLLHEPIT